MPAFGLALRLWPPRAGYSVPAFRCQLVGADGAVTARNEGRDPSGFRLRRIRGGMGSVGRPVSRQALFCFCERILRTRAPLMRTLTREVVAQAR